MNKINPYIESKGGKPMTQGNKLANIVLRPEVSLTELSDTLHFLSKYSKIELESAEIKLKYQGYIDRENNLADKLLRLDYVTIPDGFDFSKFKSISTEARQKLQRIQPTSIGQASRIPGVSPADINTILVALGR